jgi:translocation and assembly module TamB
MVEPSPVNAVPAHAPPSPLRTGLGLLLPLFCIVALLLLVLGGAAGTARWLLATEEGTLWLLARLPMVKAEGVKGAFLGDRWHADRLRVHWDGGRQWLLLEGVDAEGLRWAWRPSEHAWLGIEAERVVARKLTLNTGPSTPGPVVLPADLAPSLQLRLAAVQLDSLVIDTLSPMNRITAVDLRLDPSPGGAWSAERVAFEGWGLAVSGSASLGHRAPYAATAQAALYPLNDGEQPRWAAVLQAGGTLPELALSGTLRGRPIAGHAAPAVDLKAGLRPFQPWVLASLALDTAALDLAALSPLAPSTQLSGHATLAGGVGQTPLQASIKLDNATPGRWNERRLPLQKLTLDMHGQRQQPERLDITRFDLVLADATRGAGRWSGSAVWLGHELTLNTVLAQVTPQRLDGRAAAMTLSGPVAATLRGLPSPDFAAAATATPPPSVRWKLDLQGQLDAAPQPVQLLMEGQADDQHLELSRVRAQAGKASAEMQARLARAGRGDWQLASTGKLDNFDPLPWWPGDAGGAWHRGPHRISGDWQFELRLPADAERLPALTLAQRVAGNGQLHLRDSLLAGVPLAADLSLGYTQAAAPTPASLRGELSLGGNRLRIDGRGDPGGGGDNDHWRVELQADTLGALAPLSRLHPALADWVPRQGTASATVAADGRWPAMRTEGQLRLSQLAVGPLTLARGSTSWRIASVGEQPLTMRLELAGLVWGPKGAEQRADHLRAELSGTVSEHRIDISGAMPLLPPTVAEQVLGIQAQSGTRAQMQATGQWLADPAGGGRWKARIDRLLFGAWDGSNTDAPPASGWAEARDLRAELLFGPGARLLALQADAGRVRLADTVALRWDEVRVDLRGERPQLLLHADIEPFALAPLLARAQPGAGWRGDLRVAARVDIRAAEKMDAELVVERKDGDLHLEGSEGTQLLGLTELKLTVSAHEGLWSFTPVFRGRSLGDITGQVRVQAAPADRWPPPEAPIAGDVQARVADIGIWSGWVPAGWRLVGELRTQAGVAGTFGAPQFNGELAGSGLGVRNLLQGVNVSDGQIAVRLAGDTAQIERFTLRGGEGTATVTGSATIGRQPRATLQLKAERFRVLGRVDRQVIASGSAKLDLGAEQTQVDGKFTLDEANFDASRGDAPSLDEDVTVRRAGEAVDRGNDNGAPKTRRNLAVTLDIDLGDKVRVRGRGLETGLRGQLRITTPGGRVAVNGTISTEGGTYAAYGQKLDIDRGIVAFSGSADNPRLDILALRPNIDTRVGVAITGNALTPRVRLFSEPDLSDSDKLSWLVLGRASDGLGRNDTALLQRAAIALFAGEGEAPTDALMKSLGIDEVSLRQGEGDVRETVISIGKQLSRRWYVGYERGVNATTGTWQLIYRIAQRFTLRAQSGQENALDVIWTWRFQETPADAGVRKSKTIPP